MRFCPSCGVERVARFCSGCGFDFDQNPEPEQGIVQENTASQADDISNTAPASESVAELGESLIGVPKESAPSSPPDLNALDPVLEPQDEPLTSENETASGTNPVAGPFDDDRPEGLELLSASEGQVSDGQGELTHEPELPVEAEDSVQREDNDLPFAEEEVIDVVLAEPELDAEVAPATEPKSEGWYPDPINKVRFRYWDGNGWTDRTAMRASEVEQEEGQAQVNFELAAPVVLEGLAYGNKYRSGSSCFNCGFMPTELTNFCECCGTALKSS